MLARITRLWFNPAQVSGPAPMTYRLRRFPHPQRTSSSHQLHSNARLRVSPVEASGASSPKSRACCRSVGLRSMRAAIPRGRTVYA